jgi:Cd2+/Zn2+-exporting ATPase
VQAHLHRLAQQGQTAVLVGTPEKPVGLLALADQVRDTSPETIRALRDIGIAHTVLLTGDNPEAAARIARAVGVDDFRANLLPDDKVAAVQDLEARHGRVIMVGDGINDAPALAVANVGVAMGAAGTDVALETADVALMADDLSRLPFAIDLSRRTLRIIQQNIAAALLIKAVFIGLTFFGFTTLWMAVGADMGASLAVIANALRLHRSRPASA